MIARVPSGIYVPTGAALGLLIPVLGTVDDDTATLIDDPTSSGEADLNNYWIYACNISGAPETLHLQIGGTGADKRCSQIITFQAGFDPVIEEFPFPRGTRLKAWAGTTAVINIMCFKRPYKP